MDKDLEEMEQLINNSPPEILEVVRLLALAATQNPDKDIQDKGTLVLNIISNKLDYEEREE